MKVGGWMDGCLEEEEKEEEVEFTVDRASGYCFVVVAWLKVSC